MQMRLARDRMEAAICLMVRDSVGPSKPPATATRKQAEEFMNERGWIMKEFERLSDPDEVWSDAEYEWFINRVLDHLGMPR